MTSCYPRPNTQRSCTTLRPLTAELSPLSRPDGSASLHVGNTHVLCAVHGPVAPRNTRWERYECGVLSVAFSRGLISSSGGGGSAGGSNSSAGNSVPSSTDENAATGVAAVNASYSSSASKIQPTAISTNTRTMKSLPLPHPPGLGATERELEYFLRDTLSSCILLERYPRCVIQVVIQIVQSDGCVLGSAVNCAVLALMDAGVAMRGLPVASTCVVIHHDDVVVEDEEGNSHTQKDRTTTVWLDPTAEEESGVGHATVVLVTDMSASSHGASIDDAADNDDDDDSGGIITSITFGAPLSIKGLLSSAECAKQSSAAMVAFMRLAIEQKVQRESQTLWS